MSPITRPTFRALERKKEKGLCTRPSIYPIVNLRIRAVEKNSSKRAPRSWIFFLYFFESRSTGRDGRRIVDSRHEDDRRPSVSGGNLSEMVSNRDRVRGRRGSPLPGLDRINDIFT